MRCLLIEDESRTLLLLKDYVQGVPFLTLVYAFGNGLEAVPIAEWESMDIVFLNIEMDGLSGLQLLETLPQ